MGPLKAPGPMACDLARETFADLYRIREVNETLIVLIPKIDNPSHLKHFRPLSLCNVIYKILIKVITNHLKDVMPMLVSPNQCSFVMERQSSGNIILAQEAFHSTCVMRGQKGFMAIKVDLEKAYDRLSWSFTTDILRDVGRDKYTTSLVGW